MKNFKKSLILLFVMIMIVSIMPFSLSANAAESGYCGENVTWQYDSQTNTLTISGTGAMGEFDMGAYPWNDYSEEIQTVIICDGVTKITGYAFGLLTNLTNITISDSVTYIAYYAFYNCDSLFSIVLPDGVTSIDPFAFSYCTNLGYITIPKSVTMIADSAFEFSSKVRILCYENSVAHNYAVEKEIDFLLLDKVIEQPSEAKISCGDSIVLHASEFLVPANGSVEWAASNDNFTYTISEDGLTCTITSSQNGDTVFTATIFDADGNEVIKSEQTMISKAGFFQKIIAFFKKIFGLAKVIPQ